MTIIVRHFITLLLLALPIIAVAETRTEQTVFSRVSTMTDAVTLNFIDHRHFERIMLVHDTVMGGRSSGNVVSHNKIALRFSGILSLENNGGFASAEFKLLKPITWLNSKALILNAEADGRRYQLRLKTPFTPQGVAYVAEFTSQHKTHDYEFGVSAFSGRYRGRPVGNLPPLSFSDITHVSVMLADKTPGPFLITLYSLSFVTIQQN
ncbi:CIA30 family protein [Rheinheimera gaetbuli]